MKRLLIVWHSKTGGARQMADAAAAAARADGGIDVRLVPAAEAGADDLLKADCYLFVAPENLAAIAGVMKDFFDRTYYAVLGRIEGRPYSVLVCAGSDGTNAVRQIERIATGWRLRLVVPSQIVCTRAQTPEAILAPKTIGAADLERCAQTGAALAAGVGAGIF